MGASKPLSACFKAFHWHRQQVWSPAELNQQAALLMIGLSCAKVRGWQRRPIVLAQLLLQWSHIIPILGP